MDYYVIGIKEGEDRTVTIYVYGRSVILQEKGLFKTGLEEICDTLIKNCCRQDLHKVMEIIEFYMKVSSPAMEVILCDEDPIKKLIHGFKEKKIRVEIKNADGAVIYGMYPEKLGYFSLIKRLCQVKGAVGHRLVRIGAMYDGGYVMLDDFEDSKNAYSFGIGDDISWDMCIADRGMDVYCYDHTIEGLPGNSQRLHFNKLGIAGEDRIEDGLLSMRSILRKNNHEKEQRLILKMDVEGAEWEFIASASPDIFGQFSQMTFELHGLTVIEEAKSVVSALRKINKTHQAVWVHANNRGGFERAGEIIMPRLLEITYVNRQMYRFVPVRYHCPLEIDAPNVQDLPDIELGDWGSLR